MGRKKINQPRKRRISMKTSMLAKLSRKNNPALSNVGADLRVCPGLSVRRGAGADTQVCPYAKHHEIFAPALITTRCDVLNTQSILILNLFLYVFLTGSAFAQ